MKIYIDVKKMNFEEDNIEHEIVWAVRDKEFLGFDYMIELPDDDKFIKNTLKIVYKKDREGKETKEIEYKYFMVREDKTWWSFPLYEIKDGKIIDFNYNNYAYFGNTDRRVRIARKINALYNPASESKILRKTLRYIMDFIKIKYPDDFKKYNDKIEEVINKNPKN